MTQREFRLLQRDPWLNPRIVVVPLGVPARKGGCAMNRFVSVVASVLTLATLSTLDEARADTTKATTIFSPSGSGTCTGVNQDGTAATWTHSGSITYVASMSRHYGYANYADSPNGNPDADRAGDTWVARVSTSSDVKSDCPAIDLVAKLTYTPYGSSTTSKILLTFSIGTDALIGPNLDYKLSGKFGSLSDVKDVQYKVVTRQTSVANSTTWTAATSYL